MASIVRYLLLSSFVSLAVAALPQAPPETFSWRYYRTTNTGIQGDWNEALLITADGDPWIGGYEPSFEEGGIAKFIQGENRWINISNVDHQVIGHPEKTGIARVSEIVEDSAGGLWMGTGRGMLFYNPSIGPASLKRFDAENSGVPGGWTEGLELAPDGSIWMSAYSTAWGEGGLAQYVPSTNSWTTYPGYGSGNVSVQPKTGGGYYVWSNSAATGYLARYDSTTQAWTDFGEVTDSPYWLPGKACTDAEGNTWMFKVTQNSYFFPVLDCRRPDGSWISPSMPTGASPSSVYAIRAYGSGKALVVDGGNVVWSFNGSTWTNLGQWKADSYTYDVDIDASGNIWVCGVGGAAKRSVTSGKWQRYRITNTSQFDYFNNDLTLDPNGGIYASANAGPGVGGMVRFDGVRWTGWNPYHYGKGFDWPFETDNTDRLYKRPSNGSLVTNPMFHFVHQLDGSAWSDLSFPHDSVKDFIEDSSGRLWATVPGGLYRLNGSAWSLISDQGGVKLHRDPAKKGTVWCQGDQVITRTDGTSTFIRTISDFPELDPNSDAFHGIAVAGGGIVWIGAYTVGLPDSGALIRLDTKDGAYRLWEMNPESPNPKLAWPFPGEYAMPLAATPDGRIWMQYDSEFLTAQRGLCWFDGKNVGVFPAPPFGDPQWGGLPHAGIMDLEVKKTQFGYELWMSCASRGIAVLNVIRKTPWIRIDHLE